MNKLAVVLIAIVLCFFAAFVVFKKTPENTGLASLPNFLNSSTEKPVQQASDSIQESVNGHRSQFCTAEPKQPKSVTNAYIASTGSFESQAAAEIIRLTNNERRAFGLSALRQNDTLTAYAQNHSNYMAQTADFSHSGTYPGNFSSWAENIAYVPKSNSTASMAVSDWMNSSGHRANILGRNSQIGVGVKCTQSYSVNYCYITQQFGS